MRLTRILNSKRGNSMLSVMGAISVLGAIAFYSSQSLINRVKFSRGLATKTEFSNLVDYIHLILSDTEACRLNFKDKIVALDATDFQTNSSFVPLNLVAPGLVSGTKNLARIGDAVGDMALTEIKFKVEGKLGKGLSASLNFKVAKPLTEQTNSSMQGSLPKAPSRSSGASERVSRIMLTVVTAPTSDPNEVTIVECSANSLGIINPTPTPPISPVYIGSGEWSRFPKGLGGRVGHSAVWTGAKMIVWGGYSNAGSMNPSSLQPASFLDTGGVFDPVTRTIVPMSTQNAPQPRTDHVAIWTGSKMIVWGGAALTTYSGGSQTFVPDGTQPWGVKTGGVYNPVSDTWTPMSQVGAPGNQDSSGNAYKWTAVWTGSQLLLLNSLKDVPGALYDPNVDSWKTMSLTNGPASNSNAVWADGKLITWGSVPWYQPGQSVEFPNGFVPVVRSYDPITDSWSSHSNPSVLPPAGPGVWTGSKVIVYGVGQSDGAGPPLATFEPTLGTWDFKLNVTGSRGPVTEHSTFWTGSQLLVWGGKKWVNAATAWTTVGPYAGGNGAFVAAMAQFDNIVRFYDPVSDRWSGDIGVVGAPDRYPKQTAVWTGNELIVFGGTRLANTYDPDLDEWGPPCPTGVNCPYADYGKIFTLSK